MYEQQEEMFSSGHGGGCRRTFVGVVVILIGVFLCMGGLFVYLDLTCASLASTWLPVYPGSELISTNYTSFRLFGVGNSLAQYETTDDATTVRNWYLSHRRAQGIFRQGQLADLDYFVSDAANGSIITLRSRCAWST
jgi:hypothetical protein